MQSVWAVARHTFFLGLRMKLALAFVVLLALALVALPLAVTGDGTLAGRIRTVLSYGIGATVFLLSLVTVFVGVASVTADVRDKHVFLLVSKPVARWQYIMGRWLGTFLLSAVLLGVAATAVYASVQYLRGRSDLLLTNNEVGDLRVVETEIFTARSRVLPNPFDVDTVVKAKLDELQKDDVRYREAMAEMMRRAGGDAERARQLLIEDFRQQVREAQQSVGPGKTIEWTFSGLRVDEGGASGTGTVRAVRDRHDKDGKKLLRRDIFVETPRTVLVHLPTVGRIKINGVDARVVALQRDGFVAAFIGDDATRGGVDRLEKGDEVRVDSPATFQLSYKITPSGSLPWKLAKGVWLARPSGPRPAWKSIRPGDDPVRMVATQNLPAVSISDEGRTTVMYGSANPVSVTIRAEDVFILHRAGGFEMNYLRGVLLVLLQLAFLAAVGVLWGSFLSFPVACLVSATMLLFCWMTGFLTEATEVGANNSGVAAMATWMMVKGLSVLLPDLSAMTPSAALVDGMAIPLSRLGWVSLFAAIPTGAALALACLIFHKRELARVQV